MFRESIEWGSTIIMIGFGILLGLLWEYAIRYDKKHNKHKPK